MDAKRGEGRAWHELHIFRPFEVLISVPELPDDSGVRSLAFCASDLSVNFCEVWSVDKSNLILHLNSCWLNQLLSDRLHILEEALEQALLALSGWFCLLLLWLFGVLFQGGLEVNVDVVLCKLSIAFHRLRLFFLDHHGFVNLRIDSLSLLTIFTFFVWSDQHL